MINCKRDVSMGNKDIVDSTYKFALRIIKLVSSLPHNKVCDVIGGQLLRAGTSVGANICQELP